jgi:hypothetical protein
MLAATDAGAFSEGIFNNIERDIRATTSEKFLTFLTVDFFVCGAAQFSKALRLERMLEFRE